MKKIKGVPTTPSEWDDLRAHIFGAYVSLRVGMGVIALLLPLALYLDGKFVHHIDLKGSMSAYYWDGVVGVFSPRTVFVGGLIALGAFFYLYKGFSNRENIALNLAAICAWIVALVPMAWNCDSERPPLAPTNVVYCPDPSYIHGTAAIVLFACLAYVAIFCARDTVEAVESAARRRFYRSAYSFTGLLMLASPATAAVMRVVFHELDSYTFFVECAGVMAFSLFWITKSIELRGTRLVLTAMRIRHVLPKKRPPHVVPATPIVADGGAEGGMKSLNLPPTTQL